MKKLILWMGFVLSYLVSTPVSAQININIINQPLWGPTGYDYVEYYYLPDTETYYYVPERQYIYRSNGQWIRTTSRPAVLRGYDLNSGYKVVINEPTPYRYHDSYKSRYGRYKGRRGQAIIRHSTDPRYYVIVNHPHHRSGGDRYKGKGHGYYKSKGQQDRYDDDDDNDDRDYRSGRGNGYGHRKGHGHGDGRDRD